MNCPICGNETIKGSIFCYIHDREKKQWINCGKCGLWHKTTEPCPRKLPRHGYKACIICGETSYGRPFCSECYNAHTPSDLFDIYEMFERQEDTPQNQCLICGAPSYDMNFCTTHLKEVNKGNWLCCFKCGDWYKKGEECSCANRANSSAESLTCLICQENSNGQHFCQSCFSKYSKRRMDIQLKNCKKVQIINEYGNRPVRCRSGLIVKSDQEKIIADELFERNIRFIYEDSIFYETEIGESKTLHPDFYLPDYDLYIEHWGFDENNCKYINQKNFKEQIYTSLNKLIIGTTVDDIDDITNFIGNLLFQYKNRKK